MEKLRRRSASPPLLPILRSRQQADLLAFLFLGPEQAHSMSELASRLGIPFTTVHREVERAELAGIVTTTRRGRERLVGANTESPYFAGLSDVIVKAFGPPQIVAEELADIHGISAAYVFGSWAARYAGIPGPRAVGDIDVLVLGDPDRDATYDAAARAEVRLAREVQVTIRAATWLDNGEGTFHDTVAGGALLQVLPDRLVNPLPTA